LGLDELDGPGDRRLTLQEVVAEVGPQLLVDEHGELDQCERVEGEVRVGDVRLDLAGGHTELGDEQTGQLFLYRAHGFAFFSGRSSQCVVFMWVACLTTGVSPHETATERERAQPAPEDMAAVRRTVQGTPGLRTPR